MSSLHTSCKVLKCVDLRAILDDLSTSNVSSVKRTSEQASKSAPRSSRLDQRPAEFIKAAAILWRALQHMGWVASTERRAMSRFHGRPHHVAMDEADAQHVCMLGLQGHQYACNGTL